MTGPSPGTGTNARIAGLGMYVPEKIVTSAEIAGRLNVSEEWIVSRVGVRERHIAAAGEAASAQGAVAAERALADAGVAPDEVDLLIVATQTPDRPVPSAACALQRRLGLSGAAFDLNAACSGFVYALTVGAQFIATGSYRNILVVGAEVVSHTVDWDDLSSCILIGDGAGAAVLQPTGPDRGILAWEMGADGRGGDFLTIPAGGSETPLTHEALDAKLDKVRMLGQEVFMFALRTVPAVTNRVLAMANLSLADVSLFVPHQANSHIIEAVARRLDLPEEKLMMNIDRYGNTVAASIPIALCEAMERGRIKSGDVVVLAGFGAGLTWGAAVVRW
ncbi:3-oxoacyl-ACP synthase III family protein [Anaeroselena agilis]|uniref:Beta-ketoacyl-[acyl-carrier-protein] synthase III n=1 Tax=Anaeroselena agilis TaxID=3063788 RepID=A0ABU3P3K5_9FIRM|nr:beta-ketoacyl-ACP synthase III [Selenomonadales bacterium 4137-cl]